MKLARNFLLACSAYLIYFFSGVNLSSCTKKEIIHDTIIKKDTVTIVDTSFSFDLKEGLVAYYNFNGGNLNDSSGNGNNITFNNATKTNDRFGRANNAYLFDGSTSYMKAANSASLNPGIITLMAVVKFNGFYHGTCHGNQIVKKGFRDQVDGIYGLRARDVSTDCNGAVDTTKEFVYGYYGNNETAQISADDAGNFIKTNVWMTIVFTYDGAQAKLYVDGLLKKTTIGTVPFTPNTDGLFIGRAENPLFPYWFNGVIDEIRIYKRPLCEEEIKKFANLKY